MESFFLLKDFFEFLLTHARMGPSRAVHGSNLITVSCTDSHKRRQLAIDRSEAGLCWRNTIRADDRSYMANLSRRISIPISSRHKGEREPMDGPAALHHPSLNQLAQVVSKEHYRHTYSHTREARVFYIKSKIESSFFIFSLRRASLINKFKMKFFLSFLARLLSQFLLICCAHIFEY